MKYKEEIQVIMTVNKFLRFHTNPPNQHYANYHEIRSPGQGCQNAPATGAITGYSEVFAGCKLLEKREK